MDTVIKSRRNTFDAICYVVKALALFFCFYPLFNVFFQYSPRDSMQLIDIRSIMTSILLLVLVLGIWLVLQPARNVSKWHKWLEICVFYGICVASILASGGCYSNYKFLFVFMVVTYTVQHGMIYGLLISVAAMVTLLGLDLLYYDVQQLSSIFQSDLAMSIMFVTISYILGRYVELENQHIDELVHLANHDGLTNLYNHRYFHEVMELQWKKARQEQQDVALLMIDIDYFKMYNDIRGHLEGDRVLSEMGRILRDYSRPGDFACRYGGEEFVMLLPNTTQEEALERAELIRQTVFAQKFEGEEYLPEHRLTISLGVAVSEPNDTSYNEVLARADGALYRAKYLRKNRVESYQNFFDRFEDIAPETKDALLSVRGLVSIVNERDDYTYSHTERVVFCCEVVARHMGLTKEDYSTLLISAYLHDVGKINVPKEVLISGRKLKSEEWEMIKTHPTAGQTVLSQIAGMELIGKIVSQHHERYDGTGYPHGLAGEQIHPLAAILSLADSFDAMTNDRPYQKKRNYCEALAEIERCSGKQYNPKYAKLFIEAIHKEIDSDTVMNFEAR